MACAKCGVAAANAAIASYYQNPDRAVMTQHSWLRGFSGCMLMMFKINLERDGCTTTMCVAYSTPVATRQ